MTQLEATTPQGALKPAPSAFGQYLRELRLRGNLTYAELAERSGVSERLVSDYERAMPHRPRRESMRLLTAGLLP